MTTRSLDTLESQTRLAWEMRREASRLYHYYQGLAAIDTEGWDLQQTLFERHAFLLRREGELRKEALTLRFHQERKEVANA